MSYIVFDKKKLKMRSFMQVCFVFFLICCAPTIGAGPEIKISAKELEIGYIEAGTSKEINISVKNVGRDTLIIKSVSAGCQCTDISIGSNRLGSGERSQLKLTYFASAELKNDDQINVVIVVRSNTKNEFDEFYLNGIIKSTDQRER